MQNIQKPTEDMLRELTFLCEYFEMPVEKITGRERKLPVIIARHFITTYFYKHSGRVLSSPSVGYMIGGRGHATVLSACKAVTNWTSNNNAMKKKWDLFLEYAKNSTATHFDNVPQL
jgi:chromosomal replication initiation ATPase DnaA